MAVGGKFYLSDQISSAKRFNFGAQMNRKIVEDNIANAQSLGGSLFSVNSSAAQEYVRLSFQAAVDRIEAAVRDRNEKILSAADKSGLFA